MPGIAATLRESLGEVWSRRGAMPLMRGRGALVTPLLMAVLLILWNIAAKPWPEEDEVKQLAHQRDASVVWLNRYPPDFELDLEGGQRFSLAENIGKRPILVTFFATWCGPCRTEMAELGRFARAAQKEDLLVLAIDMDEKRDAVQAFIQREKIPFPVGIDQEGRIAKSMGVRSVPTSMFIGLDGRVALYQVGAITNAEIALQGPIARQHNIRAAKQQISAERYRRELENQPSMPREWSDPSQARKKVALDEAHRALAARLRCAECDEDILKCGCEYCLDIQKRLAILDLKERSDDEILHELYFMNGGDAGAARR